MLVYFDTRLLTKR